MKYKLTNIERRVLVVQIVLVFGILGYLFFANTPSAIFPIAGQVVSDPDFVFEIENGNTVVISVDKSFSNPIKLEEGSEVILPPGTYYWKVRGLFKDSEIREFVIESNVGLNLREGEEKNILENSGNVDVEVSEKRKGITTDFSISVGDSVEVDTKSESYEGEQK